MNHALTESEVEKIAQIAHEANRAYCVTIGDHTQLAWADAPMWQRESAANGVRAIADGTVSGPECSHASWMKEKELGGWKYGPTKDPEKKEHPCMVPYEDLPAAQRRKDHLYLAVVRSLLATLP